ncbi:MAG: WbuC family cupin fold metalloprotein [Elusimicrobia bacterium]|nr:WbuC family cupin fold metalloprotein [Elusimicrobiota bacterium]
MEFVRVNPEVIVAAEPLVAVSAAQVGSLRAQAAGNARRRMRLCAHRNAADKVNEMIIALSRGTYVRPHRHRAKSESFHIIAGRLDVVVFDDSGRLARVIPMGDYASQKTFYCRLSTASYHTVIIRSESAVFHETVPGPFDRSDTEWAPWAPAEDDASGSRRYFADLAASARLRTRPARARRPRPSPR